MDIGEINTRLDLACQNIAVEAAKLSRRIKAAFDEFNKSMSELGPSVD